MTADPRYLYLRGSWATCSIIVWYAAVLYSQFLYIRWFGAGFVALSSVADFVIWTYPPTDINQTAKLLFILRIYCNSLLYCLPDTLLRKLQSVQNATARLITGTRRRDHITPVLREHHWLPIWERVRFKVACLVRQSLSRQAPFYLADDCCLVSDNTRRSLRSSDVPTCVVPWTLSSYGDRTFAAALDLACGTFFRSSYAIQTSPIRTVQTTAEGTPFSGSMNTALCDFWYAAP